MPEEILEKLRPDRDLQCYFERPSAIAALSDAAPEGFTLSGCWRQQFDWAVVEWNRDNVFEHPLLRNLPDGDLSGLHLSYEESRTNCIAMDSGLYPTVDWPFLRIWAGDPGAEVVYKVRLKDHATAVAGAVSPAWAEFALGGTVQQGDVIGLAWSGEHYTHQAYYDDTVETVAAAICAGINAFSPVMKAERTGAVVRLFWVGQGGTVEQSRVGAEGNRVGVYSYSSAAAVTWDAEWKVLSGGTSPERWRVDLDFSDLRDVDDVLVPTAKVRKMRWTWAAELQMGEFCRSEFQVAVSNWTVTGEGRAYSVAGPGSMRVEDDDAAAVYQGLWPASRGNFSGGTIHATTAANGAVRVTYRAEREHELYLGTRYCPAAVTAGVRVDQGTERELDLCVPGEDVLARVHLGTFGPGRHEVQLRRLGETGTLYFDFVEIAYPSVHLPQIEAEERLTLATDWDTDHSIALPPERTAWLIDRLGFRGRVNHYVGAMWFYEMTTADAAYACGSVVFSGTPQPNSVVQVRIGREGFAPLTVDHLVHLGDTAETIARAFALELNNGYTLVRAEATGATLQVWARALGGEGNTITLSASPAAGPFSATASGSKLSGGLNGRWITDVVASPRLNRAARDWSRSFYAELARRGLTATAAFSTELQHGDTSVAAGLAQRYPDGAAVVLLTPAVQTNFSPVSLNYWREVYREMAQTMMEGGLEPYLQFGEVQWWYFPSNGSGLPFYDEYTTTRFMAEHGRPLPEFRDSSADPAQFPVETAFLAGLIGEFTTAVMSYVRASYPECKFEVLYPTDVNEPAFNRAVNYPQPAWTPATLDCLKTESFTYTFARNLNRCLESMDFGRALGFPREKRSHLVGIGDGSTPWEREARWADTEPLESVVLFALDQMCLVGYRLPVMRLQRRSILELE